MTARWVADAPVRLDFAGGWTDVAPFAVREGGCVVNAAIDLHATATVTDHPQGVRITCEDSGASIAFRDGAWWPADVEALAFHRAALRRHFVPNVSIASRTRAPRGSGLGGSGALGVALVAALEAAVGSHPTAPWLAEAAFRFEAIEAAIPGGRQDQYAAALGGFQHLRFSDERVTHAALRLEPAFLEALRHHIVICYTGISRTSGRTIARVMQAYAAGAPRVTGALRAMIDVAEAMVEALEAGDLARTGVLMSENWMHQQALDDQMQCPEMAMLEVAMRDAGVIGAKAAGSGAGGSIFFLVRDRAAAAAAAARCGATILPFHWAPEGVQVRSS